MKLKVVCQVCGDTTIIDMEEPIGPEPRWEQYALGQFGVETEGKYEEIWICSRCHEECILACESAYDVVAYDYDKLGELVKTSLEGSEHAVVVSHEGNVVYLRKFSDHTQAMKHYRNLLQSMKRKAEKNELEGEITITNEETVIREAEEGRTEEEVPYYVE